MMGIEKLDNIDVSKLYEIEYFIGIPVFIAIDDRW
jgi:hypothetical protein